jgi:hypothetical protein
MNKIISITCFVLCLLLGVISCKKNNLVVDKDITPPAYAKFNVRTDADTASTYYIKSDNATFKIPIGVTTVSDKDRTIQLCYTSSTAMAGTQYTAPATVVIPAGKVVDTLVIQGMFAGYPLSSRKDLLTIKICGGDVPANAYWSTYYLTLRKYCDVIFPDLTGDYNSTMEYLNDGSFNYGPYSTAVINLTSTGPTTGSGDFVNLFDYGWNNIHFTMDWTDPSNFKINVPLQATGATYTATNGNYAYIQGTGGSFSSCDQTFTITVNLLDNSQGLQYAGYQFRLAR